MKNLNGKTALVTGASRGIGVHIVDALTKKGVNVIGIARGENGLKATAETVSENPGSFEHFVFDLSLTDEIMSFIAEQVAPHKKIRKLDIVDEIPKSASGKILRRVLVEQERTNVKS